MDPDRIFDALASPARRALLVELARGERTTSELAARFGATAPGMSRHLSILEGAGLATSRREGQRVLYALVRDTLMEALSSFAAALAAHAEPARTRRQRDAI